MRQAVSQDARRQAGPQQRRILAGRDLEPEAVPRAGLAVDPGRAGPGAQRLIEVDQEGGQQANQSGHESAWAFTQRRQGQRGDEQCQAWRGQPDERMVADAKAERRQEAVEPGRAAVTPPLDCDQVGQDNKAEDRGVDFGDGGVDPDGAGGGQDQAGQAS